MARADGKGVRRRHGTRVAYRIEFSSDQSNRETLNEVLISPGQPTGPVSDWPLRPVAAT